MWMSPSFRGRRKCGVDVVSDPVIIGALESSALQREVRRVLGREGFRLVVYPIGRVRGLPPGTGPIMLQVAEDGSPLEVLRARRPDLGPWLPIKHRDDRASRPPPHGFTFPAGKADAFLRDVRWGWVDWAERHLIRRLDRVPARPAPVRSAVRLVLGQRPLDPGLEHGSLNDGTLASMAAAVGASVDHLSRAARRVGLDLRRLNDCWLLLLAVVVRLEERSWEGVAWRLRYSGEPGVNALFRRVTQMSPTRFEASGRGGLGGRLEDCRLVLAVDDAEEG
jgi:AraC-like DNA-binding protein